MSVSQLPTVGIICVEYRRHKFDHLGQGHWHRVKAVIELLETDYGHVPAAEFGPRLMQEVKQKFVSWGNCRKFCNEQIRDVRLIFKFAAAWELIDFQAYERLKLCEMLKYGECRDADKRPPAKLLQVTQILPFLSDTVQAMLRFHVGTGCRPGEMFGCTTGQIEFASDDCAYYWLDKHKTERFDRGRVIPIVGDALKAAMPFIEKRWHLKQPDVPILMTTKNSRWNRNSYRLAVVRACDAAGVRRFAPYDLRGLAGKRALEAGGLEAASALLGHADKRITQAFYTGVDLKRAEAVARQVSINTNTDL